MLATLVSGPGVGCGQRVVGTSEASRGHRDPAHGGGWKPLAASGAEPRRQPNSHARRTSRLLRDPQPTRACCAARLLRLHLARRGGGTSRGSSSQAGAGCPVSPPPPVDPAAAAARPGWRGRSRAGAESSRCRGYLHLGGGRGGGPRGRGGGGGERPARGAGERAAGSAGWDPSSRLPGGARGRINTSRAPGEKRTLPAPPPAPPAPPAQLSARRRAARLRRGARSSSCGRSGAAESGGLGRRRPGRGADERRRLRARAGLCLPSARRPSGAAAPGAQGPGR